jgi:hypothetical protein
MIKPFTFLCMVACVGSGMYLYSEKHSAEMLDRQITHVIHATEAARQRTGLLRADWALLNEPGRLQTMADQYLALKPMAPNQFVQMADLATRLPAPVAPPPAGTASTDDAADDAAADAATANPPVTADAALKAAPDDPGIADTQADKPALVALKPAPPVVAHTTPASHAAPKLLAHATPKKPQHPTALASRDGYGRDNPLAHSAPLPLATPRPIGARVMAAMARPDHMPHSSIGGWSSVRPAVAAAPRIVGPAPYVGSALAGTGSLPPPVPLGAQ